MSTLNIQLLLAGSIQRVAHTNRYSTYHLTRHENVAEHTGFVVLYCLFIGEALESEGVEIDWPKLLKSAAVHDLDEALTGDVLRSVKYNTPGLKEALDLAAKKVILEIEEETGVCGIFEYWESAKDNSLEGIIMKLVDGLGVASYIIGEYLCGNRHLNHIFPEVLEYLGDLLELARNHSLVLYNLVRDARAFLQRFIQEQQMSIQPLHKVYK